jgi:hypothetical protein
MGGSLTTVESVFKTKGMELLVDNGHGVVVG